MLDGRGNIASMILLRPVCGSVAITLHLTTTTAVHHRPPLFYPGNPKAHIEMLRRISRAEGAASLQNILHLGEKRGINDNIFYYDIDMCSFTLPTCCYLCEHCSHCHSEARSAVRVQRGNATAKICCVILVA